MQKIFEESEYIRESTKYIRYIKTLAYIKIIEDAIHLMLQMLHTQNI